MDKAQLFDDAVKSLERMVAIQSSDGNYNYDQYVHGLANGLILALATIQDVEPEFLDPPDEWLKDISIERIKKALIEEYGGTDERTSS